MEKQHTKFIGFRLTPALRAAIEAEARREGETLSRVAHRILVAHYRALGVLPDANAGQPAEAR